MGPTRQSQPFSLWHFNKYFVGTPLPAVTTSGSARFTEGGAAGRYGRPQGGRHRAPKGRPDHLHQDVRRRWAWITDGAFKHIVLRGQWQLQNGRVHVVVHPSLLKLHQLRQPQLLQVTDTKRCAPHGLDVPSGARLIWLDAKGRL